MLSRRTVTNSWNADWGDKGKSINFKSGTAKPRRGVLGNDEPHDQQFTAPGDDICNCLLKIWI